MIKTIEYFNGMCFAIDSMRHNLKYMYKAMNNITQQN